MKLLVLAVLVQLSLVRADVPGSFVNRTLLGMQPASLSTGMCDGHRYYTNCGMGSCYDVQVCLGPSTEYRSCSMSNPDKPFCNNGECSAEPVFSQMCWPTQIYCTSEGWFPDPKTCSIYHSCEGPYMMSDVYQCPSGYVFNPETTFCKKKQTDEDCIKLDCRQKTALTPFGNSKKYFAFCNPMGISTYDIRVYQCPAEMEFNGKTCVFKCPDEGLFAMVSNSKVYYDCAAAGEDGVAEVCEEELVYDSVTKFCV
ncbi:conserved hypothetical protein [Culex quinquefasciatus]|uniref:Chitin-binding type-2 domain-containing protein n=1 Tax=Culex quinquefasciatus TaxID=7176 RepID=B0X3J3_CULQU|nr:conserved hypothetical protein [Culex quinquefasciatus]|eukprot:XP_001864215.1 conserved hypothetical protein [Culex quinquefasciatus]